MTGMLTVRIAILYWDENVHLPRSHFMHTFASQTFKNHPRSSFHETSVLFLLIDEFHDTILNDVRWDIKKINV